ncbi:LytTR family DNA-binding domain-containing protein [Dyadobacter sp. CY356]|uniref:LytR/AlgR family response regulator transcription factor n=1 Tax=Dyadobacter sp. CY356 TaxID=2906442 RepID=UPI001F34FEC9|nr:LytTR family DNA-binding domain-containing protein [Dyadobacter sp. CY356]MCF0055109.1 LytTR family DNA-binding domain-containing protein [Dyadobacter sp. CY356]
MKQTTMHPLRCLIVDDESAAHKTIKFYISKIPGLEFSEGCMNAVKALEVISTRDFDIIFLDVDMPYISGLEFLRIAGKISASVIMTTAHARFAIDGFEHHVADFLLKPFSMERFLKAVHKVRMLRIDKSIRTDLQDPGQGANNCDPMHPFQLLVKNGASDQILPNLRQVPAFEEKMMWIRVDKIILPVEYQHLLMITGCGNYVHIYAKGKKHLVRTSLALLSARLPETFIKTHKSYIINGQLVEKLNGNEIVMNGGMQTAKLSRYLRSEVLKKLGPLYG